MTDSWLSALGGRFTESPHTQAAPLHQLRPAKSELDPAAKRRFGERSTVERVNSNLLENFGGTFVRVRGSLKVMCHLMFGLLALTAMQLFHLLE